MTERVATTLGLYPLPDWAKDELSSLKGHQKGDLVDGNEGPEVREAYERVREELIEDQRAAGLDRIVEGQGRWDDFLAHPLAVHDGVETGGIVRYYDNNNFYRDPRVVGELTASGDVAAELDAARGLLQDDESLQAVLPGPYTLAELATDEYYGDVCGSEAPARQPEPPDGGSGDEAEFLAAVAEFLAGETEALPPHETLFLLDPSLVTDPPADGENERVSEAVDTIANATDADVVLQSYWGAHEEETYAHLMDADIDAFGFDFVAGDRDAHLYNVTEFGTKSDISLGLVDGQNTAVESPETVAERIDWVQEQIPSQEFDTVYATPNTELAYLPVSTYREKLSVLAEAAETAPETEVSA